MRTSSAWQRPAGAASCRPRTSGARLVAPAEEGCQAGGEAEAGDDLGDPQKHAPLSARFIVEMRVKPGLSAVGTGTRRPQSTKEAEPVSTDEAKGRMKE